MRELTADEIEKFACRRNVRRIAVENFLMTVDNNDSLGDALANLGMDAGLYKWNRETVGAITKGIYLAGGVVR